MVQASRRAGRGWLLIAGAKAFFIVSSYATQLLLPRWLGSVQDFGLYSTAMNLASMLNNVLIATTVQTVSKFVADGGRRSAEPDHELQQQVLRQALLWQLVVGLVLACGSLVSAKWVSTDVLLDPALTPLLRTAAVVIFAYALYGVCVGLLNGQQRFASQARLDMLFSVLRMIGILSAAALGFGAFGAIAGFATASLLVTVVAFFWVGIGRARVGTGAGGAPVPWGTWVAFTAPLWLYQVSLNGLMQVDLAVLKRGIASLGLQAGMLPIAAAANASRYAGYYRAAQLFAFVPYQLVLAMTMVIFPLVTRAAAAADKERLRVVIAQALRATLLLLAAIAAPVAGAADGIMRLAYPSEYLAGVPALRVLVVGLSLFAFFVVSATMLNSAGRPGLSAAIGLLALTFTVLLTDRAVVLTGLNGPLLRNAAWATSCGSSVALSMTALALWRCHGAFMPPATALRVPLAAGVAYFIAAAMPHAAPLGALGALVAGGAGYLAVLMLTGELKQSDLSWLRSVVRRG